MDALLLVRARVRFPGKQLSVLWAVKTTGGPLVRTDRLCSQKAEVARGEKKTESTRGDRLTEPAQRRLNGETRSPAFRRMTHLKREFAGEAPAG